MAMYSCYQIEQVFATVLLCYKNKNETSVVPRGKIKSRREPEDIRDWRLYLWGETAAFGGREQACFKYKTEITRLPNSA